MAYRNGTYVAFDGCGTTDPTDGDMKYYRMLQAWSSNEDIDFSFSDSHKKTYAVKDTSLIEETLKPRLLERVRNSKNMLLILSENTSWNRGLLNYEIEKAVDEYDIPIIVVYPGRNNILRDVKGWYELFYGSDYKLYRRTINLSSFWPKALSVRIRNGSARCIHIPFKKEPILKAIGQFPSSTNELTSSYHFYSPETYEKWNLI